MKSARIDIIRMYKVDKRTFNYIVQNICSRPSIVAQISDTDEIVQYTLHYDTYRKKRIEELYNYSKAFSEAKGEIHVSPDFSNNLHVISKDEVAMTSSIIPTSFHNECDATSDLGSDAPNARISMEIIFHDELVNKINEEIFDSTISVKYVNSFLRNNIGQLRRSYIMMPLKMKMKDGGRTEYAQMFIDIFYAGFIAVRFSLPMDGVDLSPLINNTYINLVDEVSMFQPIRSWGSNQEYKSISVSNFSEIIDLYFVSLFPIRKKILIEHSEYCYISLLSCDEVVDLENADMEFMQFVYSLVHAPINQVTKPSEKQCQSFWNNENNYFSNSAHSRIYLSTQNRSVLVSNSHTDDKMCDSDSVIPNNYYHSYFWGTIYSIHTYLMQDLQYSNEILKNNYYDFNDLNIESLKLAIYISNFYKNAYGSVIDLNNRIEHIANLHIKKEEFLNRNNNVKNYLNYKREKRINNITIAGTIITTLMTLFLSFNNILEFLMIMFDSPPQGSEKFAELKNVSFFISITLSSVVLISLLFYWKDFILSKFKSYLWQKSLLKTKKL